MKEKILKFICNKKNIPYIIFSILFIIIFLSTSVFSLVKLSGNVANLSISSSDNRASLMIEGYNDETGFLYSDTKKVTIKANFNSEKSTNKKVIISLKEGLSYISYPVLEVKNSNFEKKIELDSYLYTAVKNVVAPTPCDMGNIGKNDLELSKVSFGDLIYEINNNITSIEFNINVKGDIARFYEEKTITDAISVQVIETATEINEETKEETSNDILSKIKTNIKLVDNDKFGISYSSHNGQESKEVFNSTSTYNSYGYTNLSYIQKKSNNISSVFSIRSVYKEIEYHLYYPEHTEFVDIYNYSNETPADSNVSTQNLSDENKVIVKLTWPSNALYGFGVKYKVSESAPVGETIEAPEVNKIIVTYYDGVKKEYSANAKHSANILDVNTFKNKLNLSVTNYYEDDDNETFIYGPMFVVANKTPGTKTNQTLEFEIEPNYQAIKINFPYDKNNATVSNIRYKTNKNNNWVSYTPKSFSGTITKIDTGLQTDEYFTAAKLTVSTYKEGYKSSGSPIYFTNAVVYGNLKSGINKAVVKLKTYDESNKDDTLVELSGTITHPENKIFLVSVNSATTHLYRANKEIVNTGEEFTVDASIAAHQYPIRTVDHTNGIKVYLRQPEGTAINPSTIKLLDKNNVDVPYSLAKKTNANDETVYVLETSYSIGRYFTEELIEKSLKLSYNIKVNLDFYKTEINIKDLITFGGVNDVEVLSTTPTKDINDINANGKTNDEIANVGDFKIRVLPDKNLAVSTFVEKDGVVSLPYDENNSETIVSLHQKEKFDYKVKIKNNFEYQINGFELYLPIPKKHMNFGEMFQTNDFYWNVSLDGNISIPEGYSIFYTTDIPSNTSEYKDLSFTSKIPDNINDITMVKIYTENVIDKSEEITISMPFKIYEARDLLIYSADKINVWNPVYCINTKEVSGVFKGTSVGAKLLNREINGKIFYDNNGNGLYNEKIDELSLDTGVDLYKLNVQTNKYELIKDAKVSYDSTKKEFYYDDYNTLKNSTLALKFKVPKGYYVSTTNSQEENTSKASKDGWITNIDADNANDLNIGFVKYDLDFSVSDMILLEGETGESTLKISSPSFFEYIKNENIAYEWELVNAEDSKYITLENNNLPYAKVTGVLKKDKVKVKATIYDKYDNSLSKEFNIKVVNDASPTIVAENITINVGDKIEFEKYVKRVTDYKENEIKLIWDGEKKNISYTSVIPNDNGIATKAGAYEVTYLLEHDGRVAIKTIKIIVDDKFGLLNPQTQDKISIVITLLVFVVSTLFILKKLD